MSFRNVARGADCCPYKALLTGCVASMLVLALLGLGVGYLGSDLWAAFAGQDEVVAGAQSLPVDAPTVSLARSNDQEFEVTKAASGANDGVVLLNDWTYTQSTQSPFFFNAPNGFDFFNPLFAFDFASPSTQGNPFGSTPFGFNTTTVNSVPVLTITPSGNGVVVTTTNGNGGTTNGFTINGFTTSSGTSTTGPISFANGASIFITITTSSIVFPVPIGTEAFSHRHGGLALVVIINVIVINVSPSR
jgi:hypothetical protein